MAARTAVKKPAPRNAKAALREQKRASTNARKPGFARGFDAGKRGRRLRAIPSTVAAINTQIRAYGKTVVARSRYLAVNNSYASSAKDEFVSAFVGNGIMPSPILKDKELRATIVETFSDWTDEADADGLTDFYGLQSVIAAEMFEAGECFVRIRPRLPEDGLTVPFQLQLLPSEMLPTEHNVTLANGARIECGIEFDAIGRRVAYWFLRKHPGETMTFDISGASQMQVRVPADQVLHLFKPLRAGQIRGIPHTLAGMITLAMLDLYDDAELERKRIAALFGAFITRPNEEAPEENPFAAQEGLRKEPGAHDKSDFTLEPGVVVDLSEGQDVKFAEPADVGVTFEPFQYRALLKAAAGFGVTYAGMTGDRRQANYGSDRGALIHFRRKIEALQNHVMIFQFCRPIWKRWFKEAVLARAIPISATAYLATPKTFDRVKWQPPRWDWIDPYKDLQAEKLAVDSGFKARSDVIESMGGDREEVDTKIAGDQASAEEKGIAFIQLAASIIVSPSETETLVEPPPPDATLPGDNGGTPGKPKPKKAPAPKPKPKPKPTKG
jgi:lambda family phage portal protein